MNSVSGNINVAVGLHKRAIMSDVLTTWIRGMYLCMDVRTTCTERQTECTAQFFLPFQLLTTVNVNVLKWR